MHWHTSESNVPRWARLLLATLLLWGVTACTLSESAGEPTTPTPTTATTQVGVLNTATPTHTLAPSTATATITSTQPAPTRAVATSVLPPTVINCRVRADWPIYSVASGDTLGRIAARVGSTVNELVSANCLANANVIAVGQALRVPRLPVTVTPPPTVTPTATATQQITYPTMNCRDPRWPQIGTDFLRIQPSQGGRPDCIEVVRETVTTVAWPTAPTGTTQVTFYRVYDGMPRADVIGVDNVPGDGFGVTYQFVTGNRDGAIWAEAIIPGQKAVQSVLTGYYLVDWSPQCPVISDGRMNVPSLSPAQVSGRCFTVAPDVQVTITWPGAPGDALSIQFAALIPEGGLQIFAEDTDGSDGWSALASYPAGTAPFMIYAIATVPDAGGDDGTDTTTVDSGLIGVVVK